MRLSTKGRYATRMMIYLALHSDDGPVRKADMAKAEGISTGYVEQILLRLSCAGLVKGRRGVGGGFTLTHDPATVTVADILNASEGQIAIVPCTIGACERDEHCPAKDLWLRANQALINVFEGTTLKDLADGATGPE